MKVRPLCLILSIILLAYMVCGTLFNKEITNKDIYCTVLMVGISILVSMSHLDSNIQADKKPQPNNNKIKDDWYTEEN